MNGPGKVTSDHLRRIAYLYVRQSSLHQVNDHRESTARQYDLKRRAQALGWRSDQIVVIDEDQGLSGSSGSLRSGFQRLVAEVGLGRAGVVMGLEVSRFARSSTDWHRLLEICALAETLILDEDGIYDPSHFNDRLLLGLKGTMSEAELHVLRARLIGGQINKARRGELYLRPPIGYIYNTHQQMVFDPDEQVQRAIRLVFETFRRSGSAKRVMQHFSAEGILFPRRIVTGPRAGEVVFVLLEHSRVLHLLHNPRYTGAYVYGRTRQRKVVVGAATHYRRLPRDEWKVFIPNAYPGYISWEEYESNQAKLRANAAGYGWDRRRSAPREGVALLQGIAVCGRCGRRMRVQYHVKKGRPISTYICVRDAIQRGEPACQIILGTGIDETVSQAVLESVTPASVEVALEVFEELRARKAEVDRLHRAQVERARQEAELAQHQYMLVRPENRLVADTLERQWNEKLRQLAEAEQEYARVSSSDAHTVSSEDRRRIQSLVSDLPRVWNDPRTPSRERKRMLRLLVEDVTLLREEVIRIQIRWKGGATTQMERPLPLNATDLRRTPTAIVEMVRALATEQTDAQIARTLNVRSLRSGTGMPFTVRNVRHVRTSYRIPGLVEHLRRAGWLTATEMASMLQVHPSTAKCFAREGILRAVRADDRGQILYEPPHGPLPTAIPGKKLRDRRVYPKLAAHVRHEVQSDA
jgi:DNA invertase Pin-like site-specific DNA recombinase